MKFYGKRSLASFLKVIMDILIIVAPLVFIGAFVLSITSGHEPVLDNLNATTVITAILYILGGSSLMAILINLRNIVASLIESNPFILKNVTRLKNIAISCFTITVCYIINFFINQQFNDFKFIVIDAKGIHTDIEFLIFFFTGCFILILSQVFKQAIEYKDDNDLTI